MAKKQAPSAPGGSRRWIAIAVVAVALVVGAGSYLAFRSLQPPAAPAPGNRPTGAKSTLSTKVILPAFPRRPRPVALPPEQFADPMIRKSYQVARNNPQLLERMPCYCGCYINPGHGNNLDCFVDKHGET